GSGGRWQMWNDDVRWQGDYQAAGVSQITFDFDNVSGNGTDANLRIGLFGSGGGWFVSDAINVADGSGWQTVGFDLASLNHVAAGGGSGTLSDTLTSVSRFEILSAANTPSFASSNLLRGDQLVADFRVDNITAVNAVPEPSATLLMIVGLGGLVMRRKRN
ncbi:PEP-CTERM sorting domain-containing protein, partial [Mariniblastus sp.]|nr:PEP-CTERM sorting domain-containing protein [Mariniblastus sp.]